MRYFAVILVLWAGQCLAGMESIVLETDLGPLAATLEIPDGASATALVLMIPGSGPTDRDGNTVGAQGKNNSLRYLAEALKGAGIASLRFDKRLIGESASTKMSERDIRFDTYVDDVRLWFAYLAQRFELPIFILGHSEGSLIGMLAAKSLDTAGLVSIAAPGRPAAEIIREQVKNQLTREQLQQVDDILQALTEGATVDSTPPEFAALFRPSVQPYLISWFRHDPAKALSELEIPVLLLYGSTDIQVPASDGEILQSSLAAARLHIVSGMNHILKSVDSDLQRQLKSYGDPGLPVSEELVDKIVDFVEN